MREHLPHIHLSPQRLAVRNERQQSSNSRIHLTGVEEIGQGRHGGNRSTRRRRRCRDAGGAAAAGKMHPAGRGHRAPIAQVLRALVDMRFALQTFPPFADQLGESAASTVPS